VTNEVVVVSAFISDYQSLWATRSSNN